MAISDFLWQNQMTIKGLDRLLRDRAIDREYNRIMDLNNKPPIPFRLRVHIHELIRKDVLQQGTGADEWLTTELSKIGIDRLRYR